MAMLCRARSLMAHCVQSTLPDFKTSLTRCTAPGQTDNASRSDNEGQPSRIAFIRTHANFMFNCQVRSASDDHADTGCVQQLRLTRRRFSAAGLAALAGAAGCAMGPSRTMELYLLAGQSNMAGRGTLEAQDGQVHAGVWSLDRGGVWVPAVDPLHFDKPGVVGVGPGRSFGLAMAAARQHATVGLVPCAVGGTSISLWQPGAFFADTGAHPYDDALRRMRLAAPAGNWRGVLWHQGESDCNKRAAPLYAERLQRLVERLRAELGHGDMQPVPVVIGQMGRWPGRPWTAWHEMVDRAHRDAARALPAVAFVAADGLGHRGDHLHFDAAAARELGRRCARAMLALQGREAA